MEEGCILQARQGSTRVFAFVGDIRYPLGPVLSEQLDQMFRAGDFEDVMIDLCETRNIDSTCLGLLARVGNYMRERFGRKPVLFSSHADISELLDCMAFDQVFAIRHETHPPITGAHEIRAAAAPSESELAWTVLEAHRTLSGLSDANRQRFQGVVSAIEAELGQRAAGGKPAG